MENNDNNTGGKAFGGDEGSAELENPQPSCTTASNGPALSQQMGDRAFAVFGLSTLVIGVVALSQVSGVRACLDSARQNPKVRAVGLDVVQRFVDAARGPDTGLELRRA